MIYVSACLLGVPCRYDGKSKPNEKVCEYLKGKEYKAICPEVAGGLPTPRLKSEIQNATGLEVINGTARLKNEEGTDVTLPFLSGAMQIIHSAKANDVELLILKESSPNCGTNTIYDGTFTKNKINGAGVLGALAKINNFKTFSENTLD